MTLAQLIQWHTDQGIAAMKRANAATSNECALANQATSILHRKAVELLATFCK